MSSLWATNSLHLSPGHAQWQLLLTVSLNWEDPTYNLDSSSCLGRTVLFSCLCPSSEFTAICHWSSPNKKNAPLNKSLSVSTPVWEVWIKQWQDQTTLWYETKQIGLHFPCIINDIISVVYSKWWNKRKNYRWDTWPVKCKVTTTGVNQCGHQRGSCSSVVLGGKK